MNLYRLAADFYVHNIIFSNFVETSLLSTMAHKLDFGIWDNATLGSRP